MSEALAGIETESLATPIVSFSTGNRDVRRRCIQCRGTFGGLRAFHERKCCSAKCAQEAVLDGKMVPNSRLSTIKQLTAAMAHEIGISLDALMFGCNPKARTWRSELFWRCRQLDPQPSFAEIAIALGFHKATVVNGVRRHLGGEPKTKCLACGKKKFGAFCSARCGVKGVSK